MNYFDQLAAWASDSRFYALETADNDIAVFVAIRHEDGATWTGTATYATSSPEAPSAGEAKSLAAKRAAKLFRQRRK